MSAARHPRRAFTGVLLALAALAGQAAAQPVGATVAAEPSTQPAMLTYFNRPIVLLRARVMGREPVERAAGVVRALDGLVSTHTTGPIAVKALDRGILISVGAQGVLVLTAADVDELSGESVDGVGAQAVERLRQALDEAAEARRPALLLRSTAVAALALSIGVLALWAVARAHRRVHGKVIAMAAQAVARSGIGDTNLLRESRLLEIERGLVSAAAVALDLVVIYVTITFVLRRFPYSRPWGESMRGFLLDTAQHFGLGVANAVPGVFTAAVVFLITRFLARMIALWFAAVEQGRLRPRWVYPETAQPTRRLLTALLWAFAIVVAYPYVPGSQTDAFKGVTVFLGLILTLGSSGLVNQIMSGFMMTYSRALRLGDFVRIGDVVGTVIHVGVLSTKLRTLHGEEVTIPNAVVVGQTTTDYSRLAEGDGVLTPTSVTIGYDTPWRQVHALLLMAAGRTAGLRTEPKPIVVQEALEDFYVRYTLMVCLDRQDARLFVLDALHANIQDLFNEYGVQIMSPNYMLDPAAPKVVPQQQWYAAPARADSSRRHA